MGQHSLRLGIPVVNEKKFLPSSQLASQEQEGGQSTPAHVPKRERKQTQGRGTESKGAMMLVNSQEQGEASEAPRVQKRWPVLARAWK